MGTFAVTYLLTLREDEHVDEKTERICLEQSAELPREVLTQGIIEEVVGRPISQNQIADNKYKVVVEWPLGDVGQDISQFLNLLYGNISLQPGIRVIHADWPALTELFEGPEFGISTIRNQYKIADRPLSATALKPLGSSPKALADLAYQFAMGEIDIIKDDHGLTDQQYAPFEQRVQACVTAVQEAKEQSGHQSCYFPNITAEGHTAEERYRQAAELGADGVLICPHIAGLGTMHRLARREEKLPIMAHPAFSGQLTINDAQGFSPDFLYGQLWRALGADFAIYPNVGGRFSFSLDQCKEINKAAHHPDSPFKPSWPTPAGGIAVEKVSHWRNVYGTDTCLLIGGSLYKRSGGLQEAAKAFSNQLIN